MKPLDIQCPICDAAPNVQCRNRDEPHERKKPHQVRVYTARNRAALLEREARPRMFQREPAEYLPVKK